MQARFYFFLNILIIYCLTTIRTNIYEESVTKSRTNFGRNDIFQKSSTAVDIFERIVKTAIECGTGNLKKLAQACQSERTLVERSKNESKVWALESNVSNYPVKYFEN